MQNLSKEEIEYFADGVSSYYQRKYDEVNPEIIAYENGITFCYNNYGLGFDGMLEYRMEKFHIYINTHGNIAFKNRANFSFAHELGHFFLPHHINAIATGRIKAHLSESGFKTDLLMEWEADFFASCLIMPKFLILKHYRSFRSFNPKIFELISGNFNVSILAAIYRVLYLNLHPIMIVRSIDNCVDKVVGRSKDFYFKLNSESELPTDSLASSFFKTGDFVKKTKTLWVVDWFDKDSDKEMHEYCLCYPQQKTVYSVLWVD